MADTEPQMAEIGAIEGVPVDVAVGRALRSAVHEHVMFTETEGGSFDGEWGISGAYHWCACGWRSDDGPWRDAETYVHGMAQAREDHLSNAMNAAVREHVDRAQAQVANAFVAWAAANEIAEPPLDWAWFGEIARRYSPLYEEHQATGNENRD